MSREIITGLLAGCLFLLAILMVIQVDTTNTSEISKITPYKGCWCPEFPLGHYTVSWEEYVIRTGKGISKSDFKKFCISPKRSGQQCCNLYQWDEDGHHPFNDTAHSYCDFIGEEYW